MVHYLFHSLLITCWFSVHILSVITYWLDISLSCLHIKDNDTSWKCYFLMPYQIINGKYLLEVLIDNSGKYISLIRTRFANLMLHNNLNTIIISIICFFHSSNLVRYYLNLKVDIISMIKSLPSHVYYY